MPSPQPLVTRIETAVKRLAEISEPAARIALTTYLENSLAMLGEPGMKVLADFESHCSWIEGVLAVEVEAAELVA